MILNDKDAFVLHYFFGNSTLLGEKHITFNNQESIFHRLPYLQNFVNYVINYRIENNINKITFSQLLELEYTFLCNNIEQIHKYHKLLDEQKKAQFEATLANDKNYRIKKLKRLMEQQ